MINQEKTKVIFVYTNLGFGGIAKSLVTVLNLIDYSKYDVTLYIRRDDVLDLINEVPSQVTTILINNEVKNRVFENNIKGKIVKGMYNLLKKKHKHFAKELYIWYKYPIQRKKEAIDLKNMDAKWDVAISYSTDDDDPIFVKDCISASKKYIFVHQSTKIAKRNVNAMKKYDGVISDNPMLVPWIESMINNRSKVIPIEIHVDYKSIIQLASDKSNSVVSNGLVVSTCGRLCSTKGYDYVVQIASELKRRGLNFLWYWIGDGPERSTMEKMIEQNNLENEIIITGFQSNPYSFIDASSIYVQPSRAEMYPLTILETLILQKLVISTKTAGGRYILEKHKCGILIDDPVKDISKIILDLSNNPKLIEQEQEKTSKINWEEDRNRYLSQIEQLLNGTIEISL